MTTALFGPFVRIRVRT